MAVDDLWDRTLGYAGASVEQTSENNNGRQPMSSGIEEKVGKPKEQRFRPGVDWVYVPKSETKNIVIAYCPLASPGEDRSSIVKKVKYNLNVSGLLKSMLELEGMKRICGPIKGGAVEDFKSLEAVLGISKVLIVSEYFLDNKKELKKLKETYGGNLVVMAEVPCKKEIDRKLKGFKPYPSIVIVASQKYGCTDFSRALQKVFRGDREESLSPEEQRDESPTNRWPRMQ